MEIEVVFIISPHAELLCKGITLLEDEVIQGDFAQFGIPQVKLSFPGHLEILESIKANFPEASLHSEKLDHGSLVLLYFLREAGWQGKVVVISMPLEEPEQYGKRLATFIKAFPDRIALIASGDLSHRLKKEGPYGLRSSGPKFDQLIAHMLSRDTSLFWLTMVPLRLVF